MSNPSTSPKIRAPRVHRPWLWALIVFAPFAIAAVVLARQNQASPPTDHERSITKGARHV